MVDRLPPMPLPALVNRRVVAFVQGLAFHRLALSFPDHANWTELTAAVREEDICINPEPAPARPRYCHICDARVYGTPEGKVPVHDTCALQWGR